MIKIVAHIPIYMDCLSDFHIVSSVLMVHSLQHGMWVSHEWHQILWQLVSHLTYYLCLCHRSLKAAADEWYQPTFSNQIRSVVSDSGHSWTFSYVYCKTLPEYALKPLTFSFIVKIFSECECSPFPSHTLMSQYWAGELNRSGTTCFIFSPTTLPWFTKWAHNLGEISSAPQR